MIYVFIMNLCKARFIAVSCKIIMDINFLGYHYMRYNFLDHYWPYCKFSCKLLVLYHCTFDSPFCFKSQELFSSITHGFGVQICTPHIHSRCLRKFLLNFQILCTFSQTSCNCFLHALCCGQGRQSCLQNDCLHTCTHCLVLCDRSMAKTNHSSQAFASFLPLSFCFPQGAGIYSVRLSKSTGS